MNKYPSSDNLFVHFGPRKAKYHFIYLFFFCDNLLVIMRKRISKLFSLKTPKWAFFFFFIFFFFKSHNFRKYLRKKHQTYLVMQHFFGTLVCQTRVPSIMFDPIAIILGTRVSIGI